MKRTPFKSKTTTENYKINKKNTHKKMRAELQQFELTRWMKRNYFKIRCNSLKGYFNISLTCRECGYEDKFHVTQEVTEKFYVRYSQKAYNCIVCNGPKDKVMRLRNNRNKIIRTYRITSC